MTTPQELKQIVSEGLLSFPVTDFDEQGDFRADTYAERLEWLAPYGASALFVAGGTGEFFSLTHNDYSNVVKTAAEVCKGKVPILAGAGGPTRVAIAYAQEAERHGANGILLMPHYLTEACQEGIAAHAEEVCKSVPNMGVIIYNRANSKLNADMLEGLAERCPNLIGFKDGVGEIENMVSIRRRLGDRGSLCRGVQGAGRAGVFVGSVQLHSEDRDGLLSRHRRGRPRDRRQADRRILPAVSGNPQPPRRLRGQHRQGGREAGRPQRRSGPRAADRSDGRRNEQAGRAHQDARSAVIRLAY
jgi:dihydrodipicolinate synthase/N-acetylneuraminate lyase